MLSGGGTGSIIESVNLDLEDGKSVLTALSACPSHGLAGRPHGRFGTHLVPAVDTSNWGGSCQASEEGYESDHDKCLVGQHDSQ